MILDQILRPAGQCISIACVGVAKHTGKTTTLNACISEAEQLGRKIGVASIGVDGEKQDAITGLPKPEIFVPMGTLIATAVKAVDAGTAVLRLLADTGISSPFGNVFLCRVERAGTVLLAGVRQIGHLQKVQKLMKEWTEPLDFILIDGAFDRISQAYMDICDYVLLATGAVVAHSIQGIAERTYQVLWRFQIPMVQDPFIKQVMQMCISQTKNVAITQDKTLHKLEESTFSPVFRLPDTTEIICLAGALTDTFIEHVVLPRKKHLQVCAVDPTKVFMKYSTLRLVERLGHRLFVYFRPEVLAITINPYDIRGRTIATDELLKSMQAIAKDIPILNVKGGGQNGF